MYVFMRAQGYRNKGRSNLISMLWDITEYLWSQTKILEPLKERFQRLKGEGFQGLRGLNVFKGLASFLDDLKKGWQKHVEFKSTPPKPANPAKTSVSGPASATADPTEESRSPELPKSQDFLLDLVSDEREREGRQIQ